MRIYTLEGPIEVGSVTTPEQIDTFIRQLQEIFLILRRNFALEEGTYGWGD